MRPPVKKPSRWSRFVLPGLLIAGQAAAQTPTPPAPAPIGAPAPAPAPTTKSGPTQKRPVKGPLPNPIIPGPNGATPEQLSELERLEQDAKRFEEVANEHRDLLGKIIRTEYDKKVKELEKKFQKAIALEEGELARRRLNAIQKFERFLAKYPRDRAYSPDVMFRLAELYFDRSKLELQTKLDAFTTLMEGHKDDNTLPIDPATGQTVIPPRPDYMLSINLYREIIREFPEYRFIDGAHYLLAYLYAEQGNQEEAKQAYLGLTCAKRSDGSPGFNALDIPAAVQAIADSADEPELTEAQRRTNPNAAQPSPPVVAVDYSTCEPLVKSRKLVDEAWVRVGEMHFDQGPTELPMAIAAYSKVVDNKKSEFYGEALYKLAWSHYRYADGPRAPAEFQAAIDKFDELVTWYDAEIAAGRQPTPVRKESIEYLAISFAENWENPGQPDTGAGLGRIHKYYKGRGKEKHVRDVYEQLGDIYSATSQWDAAVVAYRTALGQTPPGETQPPFPEWLLRRENPRVHKKLILSLEKKGDQASSELAFQERAKLADIYREGNPSNPNDPNDPASDWWKANILDREALDDARALTEGSIIESAKHFHEIAQVRRKQWKLEPKPAEKKLLEEEYKRLYNEAARLYEVYIQKYPNSRDTYEVSFFLAEALYWSGQFEKAAPWYAWVRDSSLGSSYNKDAALSYVNSWEQAYLVALADPNSGVPKLLNPCKENKDPKKPCAVVTKDAQPIPLANIEVKLRDAYDEYQTKLNKKDDSSAAMLQAAALISFKHLEFADAERRFKKVYDEYCSTNEAAEAGQGILAIYQIQERLDDIQSWLEKIQKDASDGKCKLGGDQGSMAGILKAVRFEKAKKLAAEGKHEEAAALYLTLYEESKREHAKDPKVPVDDDALWNAARSYEDMGRPKRAVEVYEKLTQEVPDSSHYADALYRMAESYKLAFDTSRAVSHYLLLATNKRFADYKYRNEALLAAAELLEQDQAYGQSADLHKQFAAAVKASDLPRSTAAYYHAAEIYEKAGQVDLMIKTLRDFNKIYGSGAGAGENVVFGHYKIAKALEKKGDKKGALAEYKQVRDQFWAKKLKTGGDAAVIAAESAFIIAEEGFGAYKAKKFKWSNINDEKKINADLDKLDKDAKAAAAVYSDIDRYETHWIIAVDVRIGDITFEAGEKLYNTPIPSDIVKLDKQNPDMGVIGLYQQKLEEQVQPFRAGAKKNWESAVEKGKKGNISNKWTDEALQRLHALDPETYPTQRPAKTDIQVEEVR